MQTLSVWKGLTFSFGKGLNNSVMHGVLSDENIRGSIKLGNVTTLIKNCVAGKVYPMGHGIAYMPRYRHCNFTLYRKTKW